MDRTSEAYASVLGDPAAWAQTAESLWKGVQVLAEQLGGCFALDPPADGATAPLDLRRSPLPPNAYMDWRVELMWPTAVLLGFAAENLIKAAYVKLKWTASEADNALPKGLKRHDLLLIAKDTGLALSDAELNLLERLTTIIKWAGRYPVPSRAAESLNIEMSRSDDLRTFGLFRARILMILNDARFPV